MVTCLEECDDKNTADGDGCSASCRLEPCVDEDGDGHQAMACGGDDCDDLDPDVNPGAPESLTGGGCDNGLDDDCDGFTDALDLGCWPCYADAECDDLDTCNGAERCASGACQAGEPLVCDNGLFCDGTEGCDPALGCQPGALPCPAPDQCVRCQEELDTCFETDGTPCDDGDACTTTSVCLTGACTPGYRDLDADGDGFVSAACGGDDCDDLAPAVNPAATEWMLDASCHDGIDNDCDQAVDGADFGCWDCLDDAECDDGLYCNGQELCGEHLGCLEGTPPCPGTECNRCQEDERACFDREGTACGDPTATACDGADTCDGLGACLARWAADGQPCDDGTVCNGAEYCLSGECRTGEPPACDDGLFCNGQETCDPILGCVPGAPPCPQNECNHCQEEQASCFDPEGTACGDPSVDQCDRADTCDGQGICDPRHVAAGTPCDDGDPCTSHDTCLEGACSASPVDLDADGDGFVAASCGGDDCEDQAAWVNPIAIEGDSPEECSDGVDDDCDGFLDRLDLGCFNPRLIKTLAIEGHAGLLTISGGTVYMGGEVWGVSQSPGSFGVLSLTDPSMVSVQPEIPGEVASVAADGLGGWYLSTESPSSLTHLFQDGSIDGQWHPDGYPREREILALAGGSVYLAGFYEDVGAGRDWHLAALDPTTGARRPFTISMNGMIHDMLADGDTLYLAGEFTWIQSQTRQRLAALDARTGELLPLSVTIDASVTDMALSGDTLFLAGPFTEVGGQARNGLAAVDMVTGQVLPWAPTIEGGATALEAQGNTVFLGGAFSTVNGQARPFLAALDGTTGELLPWTSPANGEVTALRATPQWLFAEGAFLEATGATRRHLAAIDVGSGALLEELTRTAGAVRAMAMEGDRLAVGGAFAGFDAAQRNGLAAISLTTGDVLDWNPETDGEVVAMRAAAGKVFVGFRTFYLNRPCVQTFDAVTGQELPGFIDVGTSCEVFSMDSNATTLFLKLTPELTAYGALHSMDLATGQPRGWPALPVINVMPVVTVDQGSVFFSGDGHDPYGGSHDLWAMDPASGLLKDWNPMLRGQNRMGILAIHADLVVSGYTYYLVPDGGLLGLARLDGATGALVWRNQDVTLISWDYCYPTPAFLIVHAEPYLIVTSANRVSDSENLGTIAVDADTGELTEWQITADQQVHGAADEGHLVLAGRRFGVWYIRIYAMH